VAIAEVAPGVYRIPVPIPFELKEVNLYLIDAGDGFVLVDTGVATDEAFSAVERGLRAHGLAFSDLSTIVVTHFHSDHAGQAGRIRKLSGAPIVMSAIDAAIIAEFHDGSPAEPREFFLTHGAPRVLGAAFQAIIPSFSHLMGRFLADVTVEGGDRIGSGREIVALLTPGHTPGHLSLLLPDEGVLLAGDHVLPHVSPNIGRHSRGDPDPLRSFLGSLDVVRRTAPRRILPAHGPVIEAPGSRIDELVEHHRKRLDHVFSVTRSTGSTVWDVAGEVFGEQREPLNAWLAFSESLAHLEYLVAEGVLRRAHDDHRIVYSPSVA
jgi:glyoxylase-like metal-dependent hydrolase (beta-lactamase superfamily II)